VLRKANGRLDNFATHENLFKKLTVYNLKHHDTTTDSIDQVVKSCENYNLHKI